MSNDFNLKQSVGELLITMHQNVSEIAHPLKQKLDHLLRTEPSAYHTDIKRQFKRRVNAEIATLLHSKISDKASYEDILIVIESVPMLVALGYYSDTEYNMEYKGL